MRTVLAALVLGLGLLVFLRFRSPADVAAPPLAHPAAPDPAPNPATEPAGALDHAELSDASQHQRAPEPVMPASDRPQGPRAHVFGRILDETGAPQEGVTVYLTSGETWREGESVPQLTIRGYSSSGFQARSDTEGRYSFDVPVPSADWVTLWLDAAPYLGLGGRNFGPAGGRNEPRLHEGDNDLGDLGLAITGAAEGEIRSADGAPIGKSRIVLQDSFPGGHVVSADADERGHFLLGHIPPGTWRLRAEADGWLSASAEGVEVKQRATTPGLLLTLERAPTLTGVVVDERGNALEGIRIWGWPTRSGKGAGARSKKDGSFSIALPQPDPYRLEVENQGFENWGGHGSDRVYSPGANGIRIELRRLTRTKILVLDAESRTPIERYAIAVAETGPGDQGENALGGPLEAQDHPGGLAELAAEPGKHTLFVEAAGYVRVQAAVQPDATGVQTLELARGGSIRGIVTHAGKPVPHAALRLRRAYFKTDPNQPDAAEDEQWFSEGYGFDVSAFLGADRILEAQTDGSFRIDALAAGTWTLEISGERAAPQVFKALKLEAQASLDLGEIVLADGARLRGRVILAAGRSPVGREVRVDGWHNEQRITNAEGSFLFEGLGPGKHTLTLERENGVDRGEQREFELAAGETKELVLDLSERGPCKVSLRLVRAQKEQSGLQVLALRVENGQRGQANALGTSGATGLVEGSCEGGSEYSFDVLSAADLPLARTAPVRLESGGDYATTIAFEAGELVIVLPESLAIPEAGHLTVILRPAKGEDRHTNLTHVCTEKSPYSMGKLVWKSRRVELGSIAAGSYKMRISANQLKKGEGASFSSESLLMVPEVEISIASEQTTTYAVEQAK